MKPYLIAYVVTLLVFLGLDVIWLTTVAQRLYRPLLGDVLLDRFSPVPACLFYLIYVGGMVFFAVAGALETGRWSTATLSGAVLGFVAYATYDLTNQATLRNWPTIVTMLDLCWGTFLTALAATAGYLAARSLANVA